MSSHWGRGRWRRCEETKQSRFRSLSPSVHEWNFPAVPATLTSLWYFRTAVQMLGLAVWLKVMGTRSNASPAGFHVSQTKQSQFDLYWYKLARRDHRGPSSSMPYLCWLFWSFYTKQEKNTACLTVWNQSQALMWRLGRQEGWGKWERREARRRQGGREREREKKRTQMKGSRQRLWGEKREREKKESGAAALRKGPVTEQVGGTQRASALVKMCGRHPGSNWSELEGFPAFESVSFNHCCWGVGKQPRHSEDTDN